MVEQIKRLLMEELNYTQHEADVTCRDLMGIQDPEVRQALMRWLAYREMSPVAAEEFDAVRLCDRMTYPSALLAIDAIRRKPEAARILREGFR